jgi:hypothetical protein
MFTALLTIMAAFAQLECDTMIERTGAGLAASAAIQTVSIWGLIGGGVAARRRGGGPAYGQPCQPKASPAPASSDTCHPPVETLTRENQQNVQREHLPASVVVGAGDFERFRALRRLRRPRTSAWFSSDDFGN